MACFYKPIEFGDDHDGPKGLLNSNIHVILHVTENSWFKEETYRDGKHKQLCTFFPNKTNANAHTLPSPGRFTCFPPHTNLAPSLTPFSQYSTSLSRWALWFCGPWSVERSSGSPIFIFFISLTYIDAVI